MLLKLVYSTQGNAYKINTEQSISGVHFQNYFKRAAKTWNEYRLSSDGTWWATDMFLQCHEVVHELIYRLDLFVYIHLYPILLAELTR